MRRLSAILSCLLAAAAAAARPAPVRAQTPQTPQGAVALRRLVEGLTVSPRVLVVGTHPEDEDAPLIAWLSRGRQIQTGYLSVTRGEAGTNAVGAESGTVLGAVRVQELLAGRRIDGAEQYFTRAFDFGFARTADEAFTHWPHEAILGDVVTVLRSFRPHVVVSTAAAGASDGNGQHDAVALLVREAFDAAGDSVRFPTARFGAPWVPSKLYEHGAGLAIGIDEYDPVLGQAYPDLAAQVRAQHRTQGAPYLSPRRATVVALRRIASRVNDATPPANERSLVDGLDTTFARLGGLAPQTVAADLAAVRAYADSARAALDLRRPSSVVPYLAGAARHAASARAGAPSCRHPSRDADAAPAVQGPCDQSALDLDAALDLLTQRSSDALLAAAGVSFDVTAEQEFLGAGDVAAVGVVMHNHGAVPVTLSDAVISGAPHVAMTPVIVPPDSVGRTYGLSSHIGDARPWWITRRTNDLFDNAPSTIDGLARSELPEAMVVPGVAVPEEIRRPSDVTVTLTVAGTTITTSVGPVMARVVHPLLGVQQRPVFGAPTISMAFDASLEWMRARKPMGHRLRLTLRSYSDREQTFSFKPLVPAGLRLDSLPKSITLAPREQRELFLYPHGTLQGGREPFGIVGLTADGARFNEGFQTVQYLHVPPVRIYRNSALWLQAVELEIPSRLNVLYVEGAADLIGSALRQVDVPTAVVGPEELLSADLSRFTTIAIGPRAYEAHRELALQTNRLLDFVRKGGTLVMLGDPTPAFQLAPRPLPYAITLARPTADRVATPTAPVSPVDPHARLLTWPNVIRDADWSDWIGERAQFVPTSVDAHYSQLIETHDPHQPPNRNTLLTLSLGRGTIVYTTLTLDQQIAAGVPGAMRLLVNLLSAGLTTR